MILLANESTVDRNFDAPRPRTWAGNFERLNLNQLVSLTLPTAGPSRTLTVAYVVYESNTVRSEFSGIAVTTAQRNSRYFPPTVRRDAAPIFACAETLEGYIKLRGLFRIRMTGHAPGTCIIHVDGNGLRMIYPRCVTVKYFSRGISTARTKIGTHYDSAIGFVKQPAGIGPLGSMR